MNQTIEIYTDGSCNPKHGIGGWAALIFIDDKKIMLQGSAIDTTHNRMELAAVINAIEYVLKEFTEINLVKIYTDSQYVEKIPQRAAKLVTKDFITKSGNKLQNTDLIQILINLLNSNNIEFIKVKAHQKTTKTPNYNREVDQLSRKIVRQKVSSNSI